jgi:hypothetical protein
MKKRVFIEYDASVEAPEVSEVTPAIEVAVEDAPEVISATEDAVEEAPEVTAIEVAVEKAPEVISATEVAIEDAPEAPETGMQKHKYNILPEMTAEEYAALKASIQKNGYDRLNFPIMVTANGSGDVIVDGWNRYKICQELQITPTFKRFEGTDEKVLEFVMKTNIRRNLTPEQWAVLAVKNEEILQTIRKQVEAETKENQVKNLAKGDKITVTTLVGNGKKDKHKNEAKAKVAKKVNTTPKLLAAVENLKEENPEEFSKMADDILKGDTTIRKIKAGKKKATALVTKAESINVVASPIEHQDNEDTENELTDEEILQMVKRVKNEVISIAKLITDKGMDNESIEVNQRHFESIEKLQLDLGIRLTGFKKSTKN